jgi:hypothetical protein
MNNIDYVVISSDDNPMYKDFYRIVAKRWFDLGFKTYYVNITDEDSIEESEWGIVHKMKSLDFVSTGFQSQVVRLFSSKFFEGNMLTSDIDMLPINGNYYNQYLNELTDNNVIIYSGQPYGNVPYYPMCYVLSHTTNFTNYLDIGNFTFSEYCRFLLQKYGEAWNTDENFMYEQFEKHKDKLIIKNRDLSRRIDRGNWSYNVNLISSGYYLDSHLLRPYHQYKKNIEQLLILVQKSNN